MAEKSFSSRIHLQLPICLASSSSDTLATTTFAHPCTNALINIAVQLTALHTMAQHKYRRGDELNKTAGYETPKPPPSLDCYALLFDTRTDPTSMNQNQRLITKNIVLPRHSTFQGELIFKCQVVPCTDQSFQLLCCSLIDKIAEFSKILRDSCLLDNIALPFSLICQAVRIKDLQTNKFSILIFKISDPFCKSLNLHWNSSVD